MKKFRYLFAGLFLLLNFLSTYAADPYQYWTNTRESNWGAYLRTGYVLGGTTPLPLPAEIRSIGKFTPEGGWTLSADVYNMFSRRCGLMTGLHFFMEGMNTGATVKNYQMGIQMGDDYLEGRFTGTDETRTYMSGFTIPLLVKFRPAPRWNINIGPYISFLMKREFDGSVYDGYLRVNDPTGEKIEISKENPATYDFSQHMRKVLWGIELGADWKITRQIMAFASLDCGMNGVFQVDFKTVAFPMYPLYATFGVAYSY